MGTKQLFRLVSNIFISLKPRGIYVYRQMWHQEICTLPAEFVCMVRGFHSAHNEDYVSCRLSAIEPPLSSHLAPSSVQGLRYSGAV